MSVATENQIDPLLLAGVVFAENRNDYNWIRGQDWSSFLYDWFNLPGGPEVKNMMAPIKNNPSLGITEVTLAVAAMMDDPEQVPANYADMSRYERGKFHENLAKNLSSDKRKELLKNVNDPQKALQYTAKYLQFLGMHRHYGTDYALWLSDYNRGLSNYQTTNEYGRRINVYRAKIQAALHFGENEQLFRDPDLRDPDILEFPYQEDDPCRPRCVIWINPSYRLPSGVDFCPECYWKGR